LAEKAITVWLHAELDLLVKRCARRDTRPLLRAGDPREILASLIEERYPIYGQADITIETDDGPHAETVDKIVTALQARVAS
jgi:shikimate kinase